MKTPFIYLLSCFIYKYHSVCTVIINWCYVLSHATTSATTDAYPKHFVVSSVSLPARYVVIHQGDGPVVAVAVMVVVVLLLPALLPIASSCMADNP